MLSVNIPSLGIRICHVLRTLLEERVLYGTLKGSLAWFIFGTLSWFYIEPSRWFFANNHLKNPLEGSLQRTL